MLAFLPHQSPAQNFFFFFPSSSCLLFTSWARIKLFSRAPLCLRKPHRRHKLTREFFSSSEPPQTRPATSSLWQSSLLELPKPHFSQQPSASRPVSVYQIDSQPDGSSIQTNSHPLGLAPSHYARLSWNWPSRPVFLPVGTILVGVPNSVRPEGLALSLSLLRDSLCLDRGPKQDILARSDSSWASSASAHHITHPKAPHQPSIFF